MVVLEAQDIGFGGSGRNVGLVNAGIAFALGAHLPVPSLAVAAGVVGFALTVAHEGAGGLHVSQWLAGVGPHWEVTVPGVETMQDEAAAMIYSDACHLHAERMQDPSLWGPMTLERMRVGLGYLLAVIVAIPLGFLIGMSPLISKALDPFIQMLKPISPLAWMP